MHSQALWPCCAGFFAKVYRGLQSKSKVAVKVVLEMDSSLMEDSVPLECLTMESISHPNIVKLYEWKLATNFSGQQRLWLVTVFCDGGSLSVSAPTILSCLVLENVRKVKLLNTSFITGRH